MHKTIRLPLFFTIVLLTLSISSWAQYGKASNSGVKSAPGKGSPSSSAGGGTGAKSSSDAGGKDTSKGTGDYRLNQSGGVGGLIKGDSGPAQNLNGRTGTEAYTPTWTPRKKNSSDGKVFKGEIGNFNRKNVTIIIQNESFRVPRSKFGKNADLDAGVPVKIRLTAKEVSRFKRNKKIKSKLLDSFNTSKPSSK